METPLISVIVPVYNIIEYLPRCVQSITAQTWQKLEILLVDDGSTDGTGELCDELAGKDARIRVFHKENGGSSSARNLGLEHAAGEYIGFVDSDDYIDSEMYERLYQGIAEYGCRIAQVGRDEIDAAGNRLPDICEPLKEAVFYRSEDFMRELLMHRGDCSFCTKLVHRSLFGLPSATEGEAFDRTEGEAHNQSEGEPFDQLEDEPFRFPQGRLNEDFHLLVRMLPRIDGLVVLPGQAYHVFYRIGSNSRKATREEFSRVFADCVDNAELVTKIAEQHFPALSATALRFGVFQRLEYLLHIPISRMTRENTQYRDIVKWIRRNWFSAMKNPHLTLKNKCYQTLFAIAPKGIRRLHKALGRADR